MNHTPDPIAALTRLSSESRNLSHEAKTVVFDKLHQLASRLDIPQSEMEVLKRAYESVGAYLATRLEYRESDLYAQGSVALGTVTRPSADDDYDVDLVLHSPCLPAPASVHDSREMLDRLMQVLAEHGGYAGKVEADAKRRCVRLIFGKFHLDITPATPADPSRPSKENAVIVPDRVHGRSDSHPRGYFNWFKSISAKSPRRLSRVALSSESRSSGTVHPFPNHKQKTVLQLIVQLLKRHRDTWAADINNAHFADHAPISIIITTLAALSYDRCVDSETFYESDWDLVQDVLNGFLDGIEKDMLGQDLIVNPALRTENFADKWRENPIKRLAFMKWYVSAVEGLVRIISTPGKGLDSFVAAASSTFGEGATRGLAGALAQPYNELRRRGDLATTSLGLLSSGACAASLPKNPSHSFHGDTDAHE